MARWPVDKATYDAWWLARVEAKTARMEGGCWVWTGRLQTKGYGAITYRGGNTSVHRQLYKILNGLEFGLDQLVCHRCDVRNCVNPDHLFLGTAKDNNRDCGNKGRHHNAIKTHCKHGHEFTFENTYLKVEATTVMRACKECDRIRGRKEWESGKALTRQRRWRAARAQNRRASQ